MISWRARFLVHVRSLVALAFLSGTGLVSAAEPDELQALRDRVEALEKQAGQVPEGDGAAKGPSSAGKELSVTWSNGFLATSADEAFRFHMGGRIEFDNSWFAQDNNLLLGPAAGTKFQDGSLFRRARLRADGLLWDWIEFVAEVNFANVQDASNVENQPVQIGSVGLTSFYLTFQNLPVVGNVRVGHFKAPVGLERYSSSNAWYYLERSSLYDAFLGPNNYQDGVLAFNSYLEDRVTVAGALTRIGNSSVQSFGFGAADGAYAGSCRVTGLPIYEEEGRELLHLGVGYQHQALIGHQFDVASRPLVRSGSGRGTDTPNVVATDTFFSPNGADLIDLELAAVCGPVSFSAEYALAHGSEVFDAFDGVTFSGPRGNVNYQAFYAEAGCFVTPGDYRRYDPKTGTWDRTVPQRDAVFGRSAGGPRGTGAIQLLARYTYLDLISGDPVLTPASPTAGARAGKQQDITLGLNWYINSQVWIMFNLVFSHIDSVVPGASGDFQALGTRIHIDF